MTEPNGRRSMIRAVKCWLGIHPKGATYNRRWVCCWFGDVSHIEFSPACTECKRWLP